MTLVEAVASKASHVLDRLATRNSWSYICELRQLCTIIITLAGQLNRVKKSETSGKIALVYRAMQCAIALQQMRTFRGQHYKACSL